MPECTCSTISEERRGICPVHLLAPIDQETVEEIEKRKQSVIRRYVIQHDTPSSLNVETVPEQISERTFQNIQGMKEQLGAKTFDDVVRMLTREMAFRKDPEKSMESRRPLIITGPPETGKTILCKRLIEKVEKVFVVDVSDEYKDLKLVGSGDLFGDIWAREKRFRFIPNQNPMFSKFEMEIIFGYLVAKMKENREASAMQDFVFVIEDAVRFSENQPIRSFISESRKFVRKTIVISQDSGPYSGFGEMLKP